MAPLDWGLGHTTRCVPVIRCIQSLGHIPVFAGNAWQCSFIDETFGGIDNIHLDGYNITYSHWNRWAQIGLLAQFPRINKTIKKEHEWLQKMAAQNQIDGIISDNRYGLYHPGIPSVIMTHQLRVQTGLNDAADGLVQQIHYKYLDRFNATWVVDAQGNANLGGKLSHPSILPARTEYIGLLSRFDSSRLRDSSEDHLVILLSGPEPQRTDLSKILFRQAARHTSKVSFIEGSNDAVAPAAIPAHITYYKRITEQELGALLEQAGMVICRSGYSTIMDLVAMGKKAILIPTPGQTEQEYLGARLHSEGFFCSIVQKGFNLQLAVNKAIAFPFRLPALTAAFGMHAPVIGRWLETL